MFGLILSIVLGFLVFVYFVGIVMAVYMMLFGDLKAQTRTQTRTDLNRQIHWMYQLGLHESSNILWKSKSNKFKRG